MASGDERSFVRANRTVERVSANRKHGSETTMCTQWVYRGGAAEANLQVSVCGKVSVPCTDDLAVLD